VSRTWEDYLYPGTDTLRNLANHTNPVLANVFERAASHNRMVEYGLGAVPRPDTYDTDHVKAIHHHLFQDVYDWAGQYRDVNLALPVPTFTDQGRGADAIHHFCQADSIDQTLRTTMTAVRHHLWENLAPHQVADDLAAASTWLSHTHPFRDGNGRTIRVLLVQLAERTGHRLDLDPDKVSATRWRTAHTLAHIDHAQHHNPNTGHLVGTFNKMLDPTPGHPHGTGHPIRLDRLLLRGFDQAHQRARPRSVEPARISPPPPTRLPPDHTGLRDHGYGR
jgi:cell filamentation protein